MGDLLAMYRAIIRAKSIYDLFMVTISMSTPSLNTEAADLESISQRCASTSVVVVDLSNMSSSSDSSSSDSEHLFLLNQISASRVTTRVGCEMDSSSSREADDHRHHHYREEEAQSSYKKRRKMTEQQPAAVTLPILKTTTNNNAASSSLELHHHQQQQRSTCSRGELLASSNDCDSRSMFASHAVAAVVASAEEEEEKESRFRPQEQRLSSSAAAGPPAAAGVDMTLLHDLGKLLKTFADFESMIEEMVDLPHLSTDGRRARVHGEEEEQLLSNGAIDRFQLLWEDRRIRVRPSFDPDLQSAHAAVITAERLIMGEWNKLLYLLGAVDFKTLHLEKSSTHGVHLRVTKRESARILKKLVDNDEKCTTIANQKSGVLFVTEKVRG